MAFYPIWVGFSLKTLILIGEHCYTDFNAKNKILNFGAKFKRCLWRHTVSHKRRLIWNNLHVSVNRVGGKAPISDHRVGFALLWHSTDWLKVTRNLRGCPPEKIRKRAVFSETPTNYTSVERL